MTTCESGSLLLPTLLRIDCSQTELEHMSMLARQNVPVAVSQYAYASGTSRTVSPRAFYVSPTNRANTNIHDRCRHDGGASDGIGCLRRACARITVTSSGSLTRGHLDPEYSFSRTRCLRVIEPGASNPAVGLCLPAFGYSINQCRSSNTSLSPSKE